MGPADILEIYNAEVRRRPVARKGFVVDDHDGLVVLKGPFEFVSAWSLTDDTLDGAVARAVEGARSRRAPLIWRVFEHDQPASLSQSLERHGLVAESAGTLMMFDLRQPLAKASTAPDVRRAATVQDVDDHLAVMDAVFDDDDAARLKATYDALLDDPSFSLFTAYVGARPVAGGRLESAPGRQFGALFGGGVRPAYRGRGLYRALVQARAEEGRRLGLRYVTTEALETSRPILEGMGFVALARETTWVLPQDAPEAFTGKTD